MLYVRGNGYVHKVIAERLNSYEQRTEEYQPLHGPFFVALKGLYDEMDDAYVRWEASDEMKQLHWKLFFIYLFGIGAVIRLCKVTAELCEWRVPKAEMPKYPRDAQNAVWLRRALRFQRTSRDS